MTKIMTPNTFINARRKRHSTKVTKDTVVLYTNFVRRIGDCNKENSPSPSQLLLPVHPDEAPMRETAVSDITDDCFGDLKPGLWLPVSLTSHCARPSFNAQQALPQSASRGAATVQDMLKTPAAIHPVITQPPALPPDLAAPRLRCPTDPAAMAPRSSVSRRISAIAELRSQRKIHTPPLPPPPLPRSFARAPKSLAPSPPRGESPPGRQLRWLSASGPAERHRPKPSGPPNGVAKRLEPFTPQPRSMTFSEQFDAGELPRLRLKHRHATRVNPNSVWTSLQVDCLPMCKGSRLPTNSNSAVSLPQQRASESAEARGTLPGVRSNAASLSVPTPPDNAAPARGSFREKRELLSPSIAAATTTKEPLKEVTSRRPPPVIVEADAAPHGTRDPGAAADSEPRKDAAACASGQADPASSQAGVRRGPAAHRSVRAAPNGDAAEEENGTSAEAVLLGDAMKCTQVTAKAPQNETKNGAASQDLTDGMLVCTPLAGGTRAVTALPESPGATRAPNGSLSAVSRRTRPFSVISSVSSKPSKYSIVTDGVSEYPDPFSGASPSFQQRLIDLSTQENETIRWERMRVGRRKPRFLNRQD